MQDEASEIRTNFHTIVAKEVPGQNHLSQSKSRTESREEAHWHDTQKVHKQNRKNGIDESKIEDWICQSADGEG
jgi:hypothetical protein